MKVYTYKKCDSCRKATKWLNEQNIPFEEIAIRETPPSITELESMLKAQGSLKPLFNTSGMDYRSMGLKDTLPNLSEQQALTLLNENGNLVKRPFVISDDIHLVGFKQAQWEAAFNRSK